ncbi:S9 family peptidase [Flavobacterium nitrogenifigens]|uniref:Dipeptidyl aminopeptidase/acylaminoacyl peptidase n=1 Tax=Flavobacterium nitrogenifigens TaxID=1617283 RepID=A0A521B475_9FLAO|nr:prolyl oligopeptidase family serine peptidase [Flavobacterium nitrogenifigens]KAF2334583.1 prolyl oligopeptidase family serine peptidase [Flavobacterium nitrogenifigens]SMO41863.1 Dipeptidyl aminopeptidase/acylaminoacyl peptidase [Flavobacterium nitrogenifigens]
MKAIKVPTGHFFRAVIFVFVLVTCPQLWGQAKQKKIMTVKDYDLWSTLSPGQLSGNGNWSSYALNYYNRNSNADTLFVQHNSSRKKYSFPGAKDGKFNGESDFACIVKDSLIVQNLKSGKTFSAPCNTDFNFSADHKFLAIFTLQSGKKFKLEIRNGQGMIIREIPDINNYIFDPEKNGIAYCFEKDNAYGVEIIQFKNTIEVTKVIEDYEVPLLGLVWKNNTIAFNEDKISDSRLHSFNISKNRLSTMDPKTTAGYPNGMKVSNPKYQKMILSTDGKSVFFWLKEKPTASDAIDPAAVQIWNSKDRLLFDFRKYKGDYRLNSKMAIWSVEGNKVQQITDREYPLGFLSADYKHAFIYDPAAYEPNTNQSQPFDLYVQDLDTGKRKLVIAHRTGDFLPLGSPDGNFLFYTKSKQCWVYNVSKDSHTIITEGLSESFFHEDYNMPIEAPSYGIGGWTKNNEIILYDKYDLWSISLDGTVKKRLTKGREMQKSYRIKVFNSDPYFSLTESKKHFLDLNKGFLLQTSNRETGQSGLSYWNLKNGMKDLVWENKKIDEIKKADNKDIYLYTDQSFELSPRLMVFNHKSTEIIQSNPHQKNFYWGRNEPIEFQVNGVKAKGFLCYPPDFKAGLKYPMVVHIYERQFSYMNEYVNPSLLTEDGFNVTNVINNGYFVLYPDMVYDYGNLAESVTKSVLSAVDEVIKKGDVDSSRVGLIGHSFGGYETDLIITQTSRFATAVAGSAWTDLVSSYLYVSGSRRQPDFYRAEENQLRIGKSLFEDMHSYLKNSPVLLAPNVETPLLGWVGENDRHIHSLQSMEFYLAMRRLEKEHTLLVYPNEGHEMGTEENAEDLNVRILQWFNRYLKNGKHQDWMNADFKR